MPKAYRAIAEYYDAEMASHRMLEQDVPFFLGQLPARRQSVLELATGTARAAIPIAQAGHSVVGTDYAQDMLAVARRKRGAVGLTERQLSLVHADALDPEGDLGRRFDWVCVFFNTFLAFTTLDQQDRVLQTARRHLKPRGRLYLDLFHPDLKRLARERENGLEPVAFHVPRYDRTVMKTTDIRRDPAKQLMHVTFHYTWFDHEGRERRERRDFNMTWLFPRELQILLERNGLRLEHLWGNYDGSELDADSPRMIARCGQM